jgi:hypothetical protein
VTRSRRRLKGRSDFVPFVAWPRDVADSDAYRSLSAYAIKLLNDLYFQYRGTNNGDLSAAWGIMQRRGWKSRDTLHKALYELLAKGMIEKTRQGGRNRCSLFAVTWKPIDECKGKLDVPATRTPSGLWKHLSTVQHAFEKQILDTPNEQRNHAERAKGADEPLQGVSLARRAC